jgi:hypothetical protein
MLFSKYKFTIPASHGEGRITTGGLRGVIEHLMVIPKYPVIYDFRILDEEEDEIFCSIDQIGRLDDKDGIVVGKTSLECIHLIVDNSSRNIDFDVILIIKER